VGKGALCAVPTISDAKRWWARHRALRVRAVRWLLPILQ
jgi:hypothetical protein